MGEWVVGVDIGGTSTRAQALRVDGGLGGRGKAGGANPNSHPADVAAKRVGEAVGDALRGISAEQVGHCVLGMAGVSKVSDPAVAREFHGALRTAGLRCGVTMVSDAEVAFASATGEPDGTVLVAGTGSVAARIVNRRKERTVGGYGWLLGDEGSAFWLGREAVRSTLGVLMRREPIGGLAEAVLAEALRPAGDQANAGWGEWAYPRLITAANAEPPIRLARFAELVSAHADDDPNAAEIVERAARLLTEQVLGTRNPTERTPIVLVGAVAAAGNPVGDMLRKALSERTSGEVLSAADGATGAAWLAAIEVVGPGAPRPQ
jgi:N-acetylglucosamine kinase-like BadF-type ATPase